MASRLNWYGPQVLASVGREVERRLDEAAIIVVTNAQDSMAESKGGVPITRGAGRGTLASAPGEPPAIRTSNLVNSVDWETIFTASGTRAAKLRRRVGTNVKYGLWLEVGTRHIKPRPWLLPALQKATGTVRSIFARRAAL